MRKRIAIITVFLLCITAGSMAYWFFYNKIFFLKLNTETLGDGGIFKKNFSNKKVYERLLGNERVQVPRQRQCDIQM